MRDKGGVMGGLVLLMRSVASDEATGLDSFLGFFFKRAGVWISWNVKQWLLKDVHILVPQNL